MPEEIGPELLGRRIAGMRVELGWTQQVLAERLAISRVAVSHLESGLSHPGERTVALLAGLFRMEPHELVAGTSYPAGKAERLPTVVARYTEVEHRLALLDADLAWIRRVGPSSEVRAVLEGWIDSLMRLRLDAADPTERAAVGQALRTVRDLAHG